MFKDKQVKSLAGDADVTQYMKTTHVSCWLIIALVIICFSFVVAWLCIGTITTTEPVTGYCKDGKIYTYISLNQSKLSNLGQYKNAQVVKDGEIVGILKVDESKFYTYDEVKEEVNNQYLFEQMNVGSKNISATIDVDPSKFEEGLQTVDIILSQIQPFDILTS